MPAATFDFTNLIIDLPAPTGGFLTVDVQTDIYADWKVALKTVNNFAPPAFDTTAGDDLGSGVNLTGTYFLRNDLGWRIRPTDEDQEVTITGNLYARDPAITKYINRTSRTVSYEILLTANPRQISTGSGVLPSDYVAIVDELMTRVMEGTETFAEAMKLIRAEAAGDIEVSGTTHLIKAANGTTTRITATADASGRDVTAVDGS